MPAAGMASMYVHASGVLLSSRGASLGIGGEVSNAPLAYGRAIYFPNVPIAMELKLAGGNCGPGDSLFMKLSQVPAGAPEAGVIIMR